VGIVNRIKRAFKSRAYRASVKNMAATITNVVEALKETLISYEMEDVVITALEKNKVAIEAIDWNSLKAVLTVIGERMEKHKPIVQAFNEATEANINLIKAEFMQKDEEDEDGKPVKINTEQHLEEVELRLKSSGFDAAVRHLVNTYNYTYQTAEHIVGYIKEVLLVDALANQYKDEVLEILSETPGYKIGAIRHMKDKHHMGLKESKAVVDSIARRYT